MSPQVQERLEYLRKQLYANVRNHRPDLYRRAVEISHLATIAFGGADEQRRAARMETAVMGLVAEAAGINPLTSEERDDQEPFVQGPDTQL